MRAGSALSLQGDLGSECRNHTGGTGVGSVQDSRAVLKMDIGRLIVTVRVRIRVPMQDARSLGQLEILTVADVYIYIYVCISICIHFYAYVSAHTMADAFHPAMKLSERIC